MTIKEAIGQLKCNVEGDYINLDDLEAFNIAIPALEKQIPKKLRVDSESWLCCPKCDETFKLHNQYHEKNRYCGNCGQKICWGDSE